MKNIGSMRFQISRNFEKMRIFKKKSRIFEFFEFLQKERRYNWGMKRHSTSPPCGNLVDGLPHDCHTKTVAKPSRLGPAQNGEPTQNFIELSMFLCITLRKVHRKPCRAYVEDQYRCNKI